MTVLLISKSDDNESVSLVFNAIQKRGGKAFRFDTDRFPTEVKLAVRYDKGTEQHTLVSQQGELNLHEVSEQSQYDWRRNGLGLINSWKSYELPQEVEKRLLQLMNCFGLHYGAIDMILTPDGRYVFLEVNPVGEFFWLESCPGLRIAEAIADLLLSHSPCRDSALQK